MTTNGVKPDYVLVNANVQLACTSEQKTNNFAQKGIQDTLKSAKNISLFDPNHDGKLGDNEYLLVQGQDDNYSVLYSLKKGTTQDAVIKELSAKYDVDTENIAKQIASNGFLQIPLKSISKPAKTTKSKPVTTATVTEKLNNNGQYNFEVKEKIINGRKQFVLTYKSKNGGFFTEKPTLGYLKEQLGLADNILVQEGDADAAAKIATPPDGAEHDFDQWYLKENIEIPISSYEIHLK